MFFASCSNETDLVEENEGFENDPQIELLYSYKSRDKISLSNEDTIPGVKLGDTLFIYIKRCKILMSLF